MSGFPRFADFFHALWNKPPFPWQEMLAERAATGHWPDAIDLPTASGKTACLDIALYALAAQADAPAGRRTAARRIWFVVDRRIVVDEAYERAKQLAEKLGDVNAGPAIRAVAERLLNLRSLPSRERPLAIARLRGGVLSDDRWARIPSQPAIITSTVDQLGSRLLFRGYGHSALAASIYAGLAGNDSLILLDEAHCAVPFLQTLRAVKMFREPKWSEIPNTTPFHLAVLSATPPGEDDDEKLEVFPANDDERQKALKHDVLQLRLTASKRAVLVSMKSEAALTRSIVDAAEKLAREGTLRIGVIVNRVARALEITEALRAKANSQFDVELLTGRIRPVERDWLIGKEAPLHRRLRASEPETLDRPLILVSTQCLEVGADFSFDALLTECASLDALRQRFGRLARLGRPEKARTFIFAAESALKDSDPIYGDALRAAWEFLWAKATIERDENGKEARSVDFGFEALRALLPPHEELRELLAPAPDAPVLLPAHVDLLCQTSPLPHPDPDISVFLHGKGRGTAEVCVAFRCDLDPECTEDWTEIVSLCPPVTSELFSVPIYRFHKWLRDDEGTDTTGDVEGQAGSEESAANPDHSSPFLIYRGRQNSVVSRDPNDIFPDSIVVLPAPREADDVTRARKLGQVLCERGFGTQRVDVWELALQHAGKTPMLRIHRETLALWIGESGCPPLRELFALIEAEEWAADELHEALSHVLEWSPEDESATPLPDWLKQLFRETASFGFSDIAQHPAGGIVLRARSAHPTADEPDFFADDDDTPSEAPEEIPLADHCAQVANIAEQLARACLGQADATLARLAGQWHDAGKLDSRFQEVLRGGVASDGGEPLAKSPRKRRAREEANAIAEVAGLPSGFRHEMLSLQLAERFCAAEFSADDRDLLLHLITSHHGHARPFAPICEDGKPPAVNGQLDGVAVNLPAEERRALIPPHRLDSGVPDRFWALVRRFGWWGLAYREAILRLADWHASAHPKNLQP